jgi:hypothetical protein
MGYTNLKIYRGGMQDWKDGGFPVERGAPVEPRVAPRPRPAARPLQAPAPAPQHRKFVRPGRRVLDWLDALASRTVGEILAAWMGLVLAFGILYWAIAALSGGSILHATGHPVPADFDGFLTSIYFSFVTAVSLGYGDVIPLGWVRAIAIVEAGSGLLIFGFIISKFISRRQEELVAEIHRIAFEDRLGRVQTNLHLVLSELQSVAEACSDQTAEPAPGTLARAESVAMVFTQELRTIHDILYRPQQEPSEEVLESILVGLAACFRQLNEMIACAPLGVARLPRLAGSLEAASRLATEICGECVPRTYAPALKSWMDQIQEMAFSLQRPAGAVSAPGTIS